MLFRPRLVALVGSAAVGLVLGCVVYVDRSCDDVACGDNAYCEEGVCYCVGGYDGNADQGCDPIQTWWLTDRCDDGLDIQWRLFAQDREWAWPGDDAVFQTPGFGKDTYEQIVCYEGEVVCVGGEAGDRVWGQGLDGKLTCEDCCYACDHGDVDVGLLPCG